MFGEYPPPDYGVEPVIFWVVLSSIFLEIDKTAKKTIELPDDFYNNLCFIEIK